MIIITDIINKVGSIYTTKIDASNSIGLSSYQITEAINKKKLIKGQFIIYEADINRSRGKKRAQNW